MLMTMLMLALWQNNGQQYKSAFDASAQAYYQGSEAKRLVDNATDKVKKEYPLVASTAPVMYAVGVKKEVKLVSRKVSLVPNTTTSYEYNQASHSGSVHITWSF